MPDTRSNGKARRPSPETRSPSAAPASAISAAPPLELTFNSRAVVWSVFVTCLLIELLFVNLDYFVNYSRGTEIPYIRRMFNITREDGLASWFAITQTMLVALTAWAIWLVTRRGGASGLRAAGWLVIAIFFTYMAADDGATIHERLGSTLKDAQKDGSLQNFPTYFWQIIFVPIFGCMGLFLMYFFWRDPATRPRAILVFLALGCMAFAVGLDFFEGLKPSHDWNVYTMIAKRVDFADFAERQFRATEYEALVHFSKSLEEFIEAFSMTLLWVAFLGHLMTVGRDVRVRFVPRAQPSAKP